jgi:hypothetical protein
METTNSGKLGLNGIGPIRYNNRVCNPSRGFDNLAAGKAMPAF